MRIERQIKTITSEKFKEMKTNKNIREGKKNPQKTAVDNSRKK